MPYAFQNNEDISSLILQADNIFEVDKDRAYFMLRELSLSLNNRVSSMTHKSCEIYIPAPEFPCIASKTLDNEGKNYNKIIVDNNFKYGNFMRDKWKEKESFIVLEHDIAPYPEAINNIMWCDHPWCAYEYFHHTGYKLYAMGCVKFSKYLVENSQEIPKDNNWINTNWNILDGKVINPLREKFGRPHLHYPSLAHVK